MVAVDRSGGSAPPGRSWTTITAVRPPEQGDGPQGPATPSDELEDLRRALYGPGADARAADAYRERRSLAEHGSATIDAAEEPTDRTGPAIDEPGPPAEEHRAGMGRMRSLLGSLAGTTAGFVAGVLLAPLLGVPPARPAIPVPSSPPTTERVTGDVSALAVFGAPQRPVDRPALVGGSTLLASSFRRLRAVPELGFDVYAARALRQQLCLVAAGRPTWSVATCAPESRFERVPLRLAFQAIDGSAGNAAVDVTATWRRIGGLEIDRREDERR